MGPPGSGKTYSLTTIIEAGLELFVISTEPDGVGSLIDAVKAKKLDMNKVHWVEVLPAAAGWSAMGDMVQTIGGNDYETITKIKSGVGKSETRKPAQKLLSTLQNFVDERTGNDYGDVTTWQPDRCLAFDSCSGLNIIGWTLTVGYKPAAHQGEWGVAMNFIEQLIIKLNSDRNCFFVLIGHMEREGDEITGVSKVMLSTLGRKLAPRIPRFFSEFVKASRYMDASKRPVFNWSTVDVQADLKSRTLPISDTISPTFLPIIKGYRDRIASAGGDTNTFSPVGNVNQTTPVAPAKPVYTPPAAPMKPRVA
jgi:hypothetical protein